MIKLVSETWKAATEATESQATTANSRYATARGVLNSYINDGGNLGDSVENLFNWINTRLISAKPNIA